MPSFTASSLAAGLIFGAIGLWIFREGKRNLNFVTPFIGIALMIYTMFTEGPLLDWGVGLLLCVAAYFLW
jgi:hypothetical protein